MPSGKPAHLRCPVERREFNDTRIHTILRTGRTRSNPSRKRGGYWLPLSYEFECMTCGHVGWTAHPDILMRRYAFIHSVINRTQQQEASK